MRGKAAVSRTEDLLDASERDDRLHPRSDLLRAVELAEALATLDDRALAALRGFLTAAAPKLLELALALGVAAAQGLVDRELGRRRGA